MQKHRDAQRLDAIRAALPSWTQDERDVTYTGRQADGDFRVVVKFRCVGCKEKVKRQIRYDPKASYAVVADAAASWVQDKHGSCNAAMKCDGISAKNAVSPPLDWHVQMEKLREQARSTQSKKDSAVDAAVKAVHEQYRKDMQELRTRRKNDTERKGRCGVPILPENVEPFKENKGDAGSAAKSRALTTGYEWNRMPGVESMMRYWCQGSTQKQLDLLCDYINRHGLGAQVAERMGEEGVLVAMSVRRYMKVEQVVIMIRRGTSRLATCGSVRSYLPMLVVQAVPTVQRVGHRSAQGPRARAGSVFSFSPRNFPVGGLVEGASLRLNGTGTKGGIVLADKKQDRLDAIAVCIDASS